MAFEPNFVETELDQTTTHTTLSNRCHHSLCQLQARRVESNDTLIAAVIGRIRSAMPTIASDAASELCVERSLILLHQFLSEADASYVSSAHPRLRVRARLRLHAQLNPEFTSAGDSG
jgi:hypothetical protein